MDAVQLFPCLLSKCDDIFHSITVFPLELVDQIHPLFDFIQLCIIRLVALQPPDQVSRKVFCGVIKIQQLSGSSRKAAVQLGSTINRIGGFPQQINGTRGIISARKQRIALGDALPDGGGIRQHLTAGRQRLLFACGQAGILDLLYLITQQIDLSLFFTLIGDDGIQLLFDLDKLPVNSIILLIYRPVLGVGIQDILMAGRVQQAYGIVLAVDVDEPTAQFPQDGCCGRHSVDAAGALALGSDLTAQGQRF